MRSHKDLKVWQEAVDFVVDIYNITKTFPKEELYGLVSQLRRAAVSVPSNIAEGAGRNTKKENNYFLYVAMGSLAEIETQHTTLPANPKAGDEWTEPHTGMSFVYVQGGEFEMG
ncbi:MAG: four helix bundle protein, partial [bacterium]|nr:four helix bundle protein [bacterium]